MNVIDMLSNTHALAVIGADREFDPIIVVESNLLA